MANTHSIERLTPDPLERLGTSINELLASATSREQLTAIRGLLSRQLQKTDEALNTVNQREVPQSRVESTGPQSAVNTLLVERHQAIVRLIEDRSASLDSIKEAVLDHFADYYDNQRSKLQKHAKGDEHMRVLVERLGWQVVQPKPEDMRDLRRCEYTTDPINGGIKQVLRPMVVNEDGRAVLPARVIPT